MTAPVYEVTVRNGLTFNPSGVYHVDAFGSIQDAVNAAEASPNGGHVLLGNDDYALTNELEITGDNITLSGAGASSRLMCGGDDGKMWLQLSGANITIEDLALVGTITDQDTTSSEAIEVLGTASNVTINRVFFTGSTAASGFSTQVRVRAGAINIDTTNCTFERVRGQLTGFGYGIQYASVTGGRITGNESIQTATQGRHHIYLSANTGGDCSGIIVDGNVLSGGTANMITCHGLSTGTVVGAQITGNTLSDHGSMHFDTGAIGLTTNCEYCRASDNLINVSERYGVHLNSSSDNANHNNEIIDNTIIGTAHTGIYNQGGESARITGNKLIDCCTITNTYAAISIDDNGIAVFDGPEVTGNTVKGTTHKYCVIIDGDGTVVKSNVFASAATQDVNIAPTATNEVIDNNIFEGDPMPVVTTASFAVTEASRVVLVDTTSLAITVTIDATQKWPGHRITVKDTAGNASSNNITINPSGAGVDDATNSGTITTDFGSMTLESDGASVWHVV